MAVYQLKVYVEVPDDFDVREDNEINEWVNRYILNVEGLCDADSLGCSVTHWGSARLLTREQYDSQYED